LDLKVLVHVGDGDTLGEGLGHLMHAARRNVNISVFIHNNGVMGLTKGQFSPSARRGYVSTTSPPSVGAPMEPVNTVAFALTGGATFVGRGFSGDRKSLISLMTQAVKHNGFAVVDILQPCVTWNRELTWKYYNEHTYSLQESGHDITNKQLALEKAFSNGEKIPIGVFYKVKAPVLSESLAIPQESQLNKHETNAKDVQAIIDGLLIP
jgi:2-oxoglutarate ferredoxin oxidoreductase subunit beta